MVGVDWSVTSDHPLGLASRRCVPEQLKSGKQNKTYSNCAWRAPPIQEDFSEHHASKRHTRSRHASSSCQDVHGLPHPTQVGGSTMHEHNLRTAKCLHK